MVSCSNGNISKLFQAQVRVYYLAMFRHSLALKLQNTMMESCLVILNDLMPTDVNGDNVQAFATDGSEGPFDEKIVKGPIRIQLSPQ
jgi:hypothetical protein